jgi:hypothetical protein
VSTNGVRTPKVVLAMDAGISLDCHNCFEVEVEEETLEGFVGLNFTTRINVAKHNIDSRSNLRRLCEDITTSSTTPTTSGWQNPYEPNFLSTLDR